MENGNIQEPVADQATDADAGDNPALGDVGSPLVSKARRKSNRALEAARANADDILGRLADAVNDAADELELKRDEVWEIVGDGDEEEGGDDEEEEEEEAGDDDGEELVEEVNALTGRMDKLINKLRGFESGLHL